MSRPMTREERRDLEKENVEDIDWDCEEEPVIGRREDPESKDFEPEDRWAFTREPVNKEERKRMLGKVVEEAVKVTFFNMSTPMETNCTDRGKEEPLGYN